MFRMRTLIAFGAGLAAAYFLDPQQGPRRRAEAARRLQGDLAPQARSAARTVAEKAPQLTSLPEAGAEALRKASPRRRPAAGGAQEGGAPPITES